MRSRSLLVLSVLTASAVLAGCGEQEAGAGGRDPGSCPTFASADGPVTADNQDQFIVKFQEGTDPAADAGARAEVWAETGEQLCLRITEQESLLTGSFVVRVDRPLDVAGQDLLISAFEDLASVEYAEPNSFASPA